MEKPMRSPLAKKRRLIDSLRSFEAKNHQAELFGGFCGDGFQTSPIPE